MRHSEILDALRQTLESRAEYSGCLAVSELKLGNGGSRADLAVFGQTFTGFEIKSFYDSTKRLRSQLSNYEQAFEFNIVVCAENHYSQVVESTNKSIGIWIIKDQALKVARRPKKNPMISKAKLLELLWKAELVELLRSKVREDNVGPILTKEDLRKSIESRCTLKEVKAFVLSALEAREAISHRTTKLAAC